MTTERPADTAAAPRPGPPPPSLRVHGLRQALAATVAAGGVLALAAALAEGRAALAGVALGTLLVCGFFLFGALNTALAAAYAPRASMLVALLTYVVQVVALGLVLAAVARSGLSERELDVRWLGGTVIVGTLVWTGALVVRTLSGAEVRR
jgi:ATP synthase protein I